MKSDRLPNNDFQLKVICRRDVHRKPEQRHFRPITGTLRPDLMERFEMVTGWELDFRGIAFEPSKSTAIFDADSMVFGDLEISRHVRFESPLDRFRPTSRVLRSIGRKSMDFLAEIGPNWNASDSSQSGVHLNPVVQPPFEWWGLAGNSGFNNGNVSHWSVDTFTNSYACFLQILKETIHVAIPRWPVQLYWRRLTRCPRVRLDESFDIAPIGCRH